MDIMHSATLRAEAKLLLPLKKHVSELFEGLTGLLFQRMEANI